MYRHYKGGLYKRLGKTVTGKGMVFDSTYLFGTARYHENTKDITIYNYEGKLYSEDNEIYVIYESLDGEYKGNVWAREVKDFESNIEYNGEKVERFARM